MATIQGYDFDDTDDDAMFDDFLARQDMREAEKERRAKSRQRRRFSNEYNDDGYDRRRRRGYDEDDRRHGRRRRRPREYGDDDDDDDDQYGRRRRRLRSYEGAEHAVNLSIRAKGVLHVDAGADLCPAYDKRSNHSQNYCFNRHFVHGARTVSSETIGLKR